MTLFDICKFNLYVAGKHAGAKQYTSAIAASFDLNSFMLYLVITILLSFHFVIGILTIPFVIMYNLEFKCDKYGSRNNDIELVNSNKTKSFENNNNNNEDIELCL